MATPSTSLTPPASPHWTDHPLTMSLQLPSTPRKISDTTQKINGVSKVTIVHTTPSQATTTKDELATDATEYKFIATPKALPPQLPPPASEEFDRFTEKFVRYVFTHPAYYEAMKAISLHSESDIILFQDLYQKIVKAIENVEKEPLENWIGFGDWEMIGEGEKETFLREVIKWNDLAKKANPNEYLGEAASLFAALYLILTFTGKEPNKHWKAFINATSQTGEILLPIGKVGFTIFQNSMWATTCIASVAGAAATIVSPAFLIRCIHGLVQSIKNN